MLVDDLKKRMMAAMKAHSIVEKELLRTALGEITMQAHTRGVDASDEMVLSVLKKLQKSTEDTLALATDATQREQLDQELGILRGMLPQAASSEAIEAALASAKPAILAAKSDGQATGVAMKQLKAAGLEVDGKAVTKVVATWRQG